MKLTELELRNLTTLHAVDLTFAPGINVFIGENGTGKSHVLKAIYAVLRAAESRPATAPDVARSLSDRLVAVFRPDDGQLGRLVRAGAKDCALWLQSGCGATHCTWTADLGDINVTEHRWEQTADAVFLPSRDVLAMFEGFAAAYQDRELSFGETYYDACLALARTPLRGESRAAADALAARTQKLLRGNRFYVDLGDGFREAHMVAEGFRKIATLAHLIQNGSIKPGGILLWDEPESGLNPRLVASLAEVLCDLAAHDVQIFVATHDYLLSQTLSLAVEYQTVPGIEMRFFSFSHEQPTDAVKIEPGATLADIQHNPILAAYAEHYDHERDLFRQEGEAEESSS